MSAMQNTGVTTVRSFIYSLSFCTEIHLIGSSLDRRADRALKGRSTQGSIARCRSRLPNHRASTRSAGRVSEELRRRPPNELFRRNQNPGSDQAGSNDRVWSGNWIGRVTKQDRQQISGGRRVMME